ncbi:helix-turn-helix transcriptional regulator [Campylobacter majalis]|uniref:helix-turn-helix transcriptional regulator n=1 Tax=Campylobacter majalis TaxID=2790656 RepID=UPI003D686122
MAKILDIVEFLSKTKQDVAPINDKNFGSSFFANSDIKYKISFFNTGHNMCYCEYECACNNDISLYMQEESGYSFICFNIGDTASAYGYNKNKFHLKPNELWIGKINADFNGLNHYKGNKIYKNKAIMISDELMREFEIFKSLSCRDDKFNFISSQIIQSQNMILNDIDNAKYYNGKLKEIFLESKILELLYKTLAQNNLDFTSCDTKYLIKAKNIMLENLQNPPTIKELAHLCATNEFKLKKEFKAHFGTTIHAMLQDERLKIAKELLVKGDINVSEAANMVGYANLSHFAKIFKTKFGVLPTQAIKQRSYYIVDRICS